MTRALALVVVLSVGLAAFPAEADTASAKRFWERLRTYELAALNDYRSRNMSSAVLVRSHSIWNLQTAAPLGPEYSACAAAAQNLAQMVSSSYFDVSRGRVPVDWLHLSSRYQNKRAACLDALGLSDDSYPLPWWFGR